MTDVEHASYDSNSYTHVNYALDAELCQHVSAELWYCPLPAALAFQAYHSEDMRLLAQYKSTLMLILA